MKKLLVVFVSVVGVLCPAAAGAALVNPVAEAQNLLVSQGREREYTTPTMLARVAAATLAYQATRRDAILADPERNPDPNTCTTVVACPIDPRVQNWTAHGGIVAPVLFTARSGATLSGHVWSTRSGRAKRPAVVIINGSIFAIEQFYWYEAQALAKDGYVVFTFDAQGEGMSDQFGHAPDQLEGAFAATPGPASSSAATARGSMTVARTR